MTGALTGDLTGALRPARTTDAGKIGAIMSAFFADTPWMPRLHSAAQDIAFCGTMIDRGWVTIAELDGAVAGFCARDGHEVNALYIDAQHRRAGLGTQLITQAQSATARLELWTHQANLPAQAFYTAHGFTEAERTDGRTNQERLPDIRYVWPGPEIAPEGARK